MFSPFIGKSLYNDEEIYFYFRNVDKDVWIDGNGDISFALQI